MAANRIIEGTGEEIASFAKKHPKDRFRLIVLEGKKKGPKPKWGGPPPEVHEETMRFIESMRGKFPVADPKIFSTDELYD